jgi:hypothetical protein
MTGPELRALRRKARATQAEAAAAGPVARPVIAIFEGDGGGIGEEKLARIVAYLERRIAVEREIRRRVDAALAESAGAAR